MDQGIRICGRSTARIAAGLLTAVLLFVSSNAFALTLEEIAKRGTVRIGVLIGGPPMGLVDEKGNPTGYDYDVAVLVAKYLGIKAEFVPLTPPARIPALQTGKVDFLISTLNPTPERAKTVMFTMPYNAFNMVIVSKGPAKIEKMADLAGKRVAANRGSPQEAALRKAAVAGTQVAVFEDDSMVTQALLSGQIDAAALPETVVKSVMQQNPSAALSIGFTVYSQGNSMAVRMGDHEILQWLNNTIHYMKSVGELDALFQKWTGGPLPRLETF